MELLQSKASGLILLLGSLLFMIAAFLPYSRVFAESDPGVRLEILQQQRKMWSTGQILFVLGSVLTVLGLFLLYSILTQAGLIVFGILLLGTNMASWTGWMLIAGTALISILMIIFKDMPPFVYYVFTFILAIKLLVEPGNVTNI